MIRRVASTACSLLPLLAVACASTGGATFHGHAAAPRVAAESVSEAEGLPLGFDRIGKLGAHCTSTFGFRAISNERLSDVDCSLGRLTWALRERAAQVGGELLVARRCHSRALGSGKGEVLHCEAGVARRAEEQSRAARGVVVSRPAPSAAEVRRLDDPVASAAWSVRVDFFPALAKHVQRPRAYDRVSELRMMPLSHMRLGEVRTRCEEACSSDLLRHGLRAAAGRLGASDLVDVRCFTDDAGNVCIGTAAAPEADPERDPRAR